MNICLSIGEQMSVLVNVSKQSSSHEFKQEEIFVKKTNTLHLF